MNAGATRRVLQAAARRLEGSPFMGDPNTPWNVVQALTLTLATKRQIETLLAEPEPQAVPATPPP